MIPKIPFGRTGHASTQLIFGAYALSDASQAQADQALELLLKYGINHIDVASMYGEAEKRLGPWMARHREGFFLATKTRKRARREAWEDLQRSLERLGVDAIDLWQMHGLTSPTGQEKALGPGGALEAMIEAREKGLVRYLGVTGHGINVPAMHIRSLERFDFDSVMLPFNHALLQDRQYAESFDRLATICRDRRVALQTIKSIARRPWGERQKTSHTFYYEPLEDREAIDLALHWAMGLEDGFVITAGDLRLLPLMLESASRFRGRPTGEQMLACEQSHGIEPVFARPGTKGIQTWGGRVYKALEALIREGFFDPAHPRTVAQVQDELADRGIATTGREDRISAFLARRVKKGLLKRERASGQWTYRVG